MTASLQERHSWQPELQVWRGKTRKNLRKHTFLQIITASTYMSQSLWLFLTLLLSLHCHIKWYFRDMVIDLQFMPGEDGCVGRCYLRLFVP